MKKIKFIKPYVDFSSVEIAPLLTRVSFVWSGDHKESLPDEFYFSVFLVEKDTTVKLHENRLYRNEEFSLNNLRISESNDFFVNVNYCVHTRYGVSIVNYRINIDILYNFLGRQIDKKEYISLCFNLHGDPSFSPDYRLLSLYTPPDYEESGFKIKIKCNNKLRMLRKKSTNPITYYDLKMPKERGEEMVSCLFSLSKLAVGTQKPNLLIKVCK